MSQPETVGSYRVIERIGAGRLGELFRARDTRFGRTVALRLVSPSLAADPAARARLTEALDAVAALSHPSLATLYEWGACPGPPAGGPHQGRGDDGGIFLASEYVAGTPLRTLLDGHPMNPLRASALAIEIGDGLAEAHARGVVHGALSPDTVIVTPTGHARIIDCGLSEWTTHASAEHPQDRHRDTFALGALLYQMLTGRKPSEEVSAASNVPGELGAIIARAFADAPGSGYDTVALMSADLRGAVVVLEDHAARREREPAAPAAAGPSRGDSRATVWLIALVVIAAALLLWRLR